ncbi:hypothetical protein ANAEL_02956, partial [Anaerolineales bacterium]
RLNEGLARKLILISATAGAGKTTLLTEWQLTLDPKRFSLAWVSLDEHDNDLVRFWTYIIAALQTIRPSLGASARSALDSMSLPNPSSARDEHTWIESTLTSLINDLATFSSDVVLTLDDYHSIALSIIQASVAFLLEHLPANMHLVIASREDPPLPLARLRARDQLIELRSADLHFTPDEANAFFNGVMKLSLTDQDCSAIETRTEGWVAGLQMAALALRGQPDPTRFIASFTGSHHFVMDYLIGEVLQRQSQDVQAFLLQTSVLERLSGGLCDAVTERIDSQAILEKLDASNLFVIPLDGERRWYRYHHLFAELLRNRLTRIQPNQMIELHRRASDWYTRNEFLNEAVTHALAIQDWVRAAQAIEQFADERVLRGELGTLLGWLEAFPAKILLERLKLGLIYAWALNMANQLDRAEQFLNQLMPLVQAMPSLLSEALATRVTIAAYRSDMPAVIELAQSALSQVPIEEARSRSRILICLGVAYDDMGNDLAAAKRAYREAFELGSVSAPGSTAGSPPPALNAFAHIPEIEWLQGNLNVASQMYEQALDLAEQGGGQPSLGLCRVHWGRASLFYEWNDLDGAARALQESIRAGEPWKNPRLLVHSYGLSALVMQARGRVDDARAMIRHAEQITRDSYSPPPTLGSLALYQIVLWIAQNDFQSIAQWEQNHATEWQAQIGRVREILAIVLARARIARYFLHHDDSTLSQARALIEPALEQSQISGLMFN